MENSLVQTIAVVSSWAQDVTKAAHFYRDVLGLELLPHHGERPHFKVGETALTILKGQARPAEGAQPANFPLLAFGVDDIEAAYRQLQAHGVDFLSDIQAGNRSRWLKFYDPAGNLLELVQIITMPAGT